MSKLVIVTKLGPRFQEPRSLEQQLEDSVIFEREKWLQLNCVPSDSLPSQYALLVTHNELDRLVTRG